VTFASVLQGSSGLLKKLGAGTLTLSNTANSYAGGTFLDNGVLAVASDSVLGAASGGVTFAGGTLEATASFTSARGMTFNGAGGAFSGPRGTGPVTPRGVVTRDSESFGPRFRGARGTIKVPLGPQSLSVELESAALAAGSAQVRAGKAENAKRRAISRSAFAGNSWAAFVRGERESSPSATLFVTTSKSTRAETARIVVLTHCS
jgi:autotransporter-associated beta strand protein